MMLASEEAPVSMELKSLTELLLLLPPNDATGADGQRGHALTPEWCLPG